jgi:hypothetical protein
MKSIKNIVYIFVLVGLTSCFQEDDPVPPYQSPPGVSSNVASMGPLYGTQWFYDLGTDSFIKVTDRESWDLAFQCGDHEYHIYTNLAKRMSVTNTGSTNFTSVSSDAGLTYRFDRSEGYIDSAAVGHWGNFSSGDAISYNWVYIVDRGITTVGSNIGKKKMQILGLTNGTYQIRVANLNGTDDQILSVTKDPDKNFAYLSLTGSGSVVDVEPDKYNWDLVFTQYTAKVEQQGTGIIEDYSVNGVLINPYNVEVAHDFVKPFADINYNDLSTYTYSQLWDAIGYDWKWYDFDAMLYLIQPGSTYIIHSTEGDYYKLRFTSFVNDLGEKGYPQFETAKF